MTQKFGPPPGRKEPKKGAIIRKTLDLTPLTDGVAIEKNTIVGQDSHKMVKVTLPDDAPDHLDYFIASTDRPDRDRDILLQSGWELDDFKNNPVWMDIHQYRRWPLGRIDFCRVIDNVLVIGVLWDIEDENAAFIKGKYDRGFARACSVGFEWLEYEWMENGGILFIRMRLTEVSAVPIGANPDALQIERDGAKGLMGQVHKLFGELKTMGNELREAISEVKTLKAMVTKVSGPLKDEHPQQPDDVEPGVKTKAAGDGTPEEPKTTKKLRVRL